MTSACLPVMGDLLKINQHLVTTCYKCRRRQRWTAVEAVERLGFNTTFAQASRALRCSACGAQGRYREVDATPCSLDQAAWGARERRRWAAEQGEQPAAGLEDYLAELTQLLGGLGELGGDGPVQWLVDGPSSGV